jgi:hypothetical protein
LGKTPAAIKPAAAAINLRRSTRIVEFELNVDGNIGTLLFERL